jgi:hypothetical protein
MLELIFGRKSQTKISLAPRPGEESLISLPFVALDATLSEHGAFNSRITSFPVESGAFFSDHVLHEPEEVSIEGIISETPLQYLGKLRDLTTGNGEFKDPVGDGYSFLLAVGGWTQPKKNFTNRPHDFRRDEETEAEFRLVDLLTEFRLYTDMGITSLNVTRDKDTGDSLRFTASFKKVKIVEVKYDLAMSKVQSPVEAPGATKQAAPKKPFADKPTKVPLKSKLYMDFIEDGTTYLTPPTP